MKICSVGYGYFPHKLAYQAESCSRLGHTYSYLVLDDKAGKLTQDAVYRVVRAPKNPLLRLIHYFRYISKNKIDIVEVYDTGILTILYVILAKLLQRKVVIFLIGMELLLKERGENKSSIKRRLKRVMLFFSLKLSNKIIYKELHMIDKLKDWRVYLKAVHLPNSVPVENFNSLKKDIDFAYINSIRKMRYPLLFLDAIRIIKEKGYEFKCVMKGFHSLNRSDDVPDIQAETDALNFIREHGLNSVVEVLPFSNDSIDYIKRSRIFILPSDVIYANYSLLEAMSYSCLPIVTVGNGAFDVIDDGVDGFVCDFLSEKMANRFEYLLNNPAEVVRMSYNSRNKIELKFNIDNWAKKLNLIYKDL